MENEIKKGREIVLVTGFGPFKGHPVNASWQAVKELRNTNIENRLNLTLVTQEIPVAYEKVSTVVPKLWSKYEPALVVHVGVSEHARCLTLESQACKTGYVKLDIDDKAPVEIIERVANDLKTCDNDGIEILRSEINLKKICDIINNNSNNEDKKCRAIVSQDAGRFLCEYIYRHSLIIDPKKTIFVHVPNLEIYSAETTAKGLYKVIKLAIEMLRESD